MYNPLTSSTKQRQFWLDLARTIAIISVTFNHALSRSFRTHEGTQGEFLQMSMAGSFFKAFLYVFSRVGVPLFLMISGTLLLRLDFEDKKTTERFLKHNWWELFRTTEIWLAIMYWYLQLSPDSLLRTEGFGKTLVGFVSTLLFINQTTMASMWYMPMILLVYLMIPVIAIALRKLGDRFFYLLFAIAVVSSMIIPNINTLSDVLHIPVRVSFAFKIADLFSIYFIYVLAGYWISIGKLSRIKTNWIIIGFAAAFMLTVHFQFCIYKSPSDYYVRYADTGILVSAALLFELFRRKDGIFESISGSITFISRISLGIYFLHICIMTGANSLLNKLLNNERYPKFFVLELSSFLVSVLIIWVTSKSKKAARYLYLIK